MPLWTNFVHFEILLMKCKNLTPFLMNSEEKCSHTNTESGICTMCGEVLNIEEFYDEIYVNKQKNHFINKFNYKYALGTGKERIIDREIAKICNSLNILPFFKQIKGLVLQKQFKFKVSPTDKVIICSYFILKQVGFPININDFMPFTESKKSRILKIFRETFKYVPNTDEYLHQIYTRTLSFISKYEFTSTLIFNEYLSYIQKFKNTNPYDLCLIAALEHQKEESTKPYLNLFSGYVKDRLRHLKSKFKYENKKS